MDTRIFERVDAISGDGLAVGFDRERLCIRVHVDGRTSTLLLTDPRDAARLAAALGAALDAPPHRDRLTRVPRKEIA